MTAWISRHTKAWWSSTSRCSISSEHKGNVSIFFQLSLVLPSNDSAFSACRAQIQVWSHATVKPLLTEKKPMPRTGRAIINSSLRSWLYKWNISRTHFSYYFKVLNTQRQFNGHLVISLMCHQTTRIHFTAMYEAASSWCKQDKLQMFSFTDK